MNNKGSAIEGKKGIYGSTLKLIAIITMLIDHIGAVVILRLISANGIKGGALTIVYYIMRGIGRLSFPIFCFLLVEGFLHTRNVWKYAVRLAIFALISEIPFDLANEGKPFYYNYQNVFFTLLIGLLVMIVFKLIAEKVKDKKWLPALAVLGVISLGCSSVYAPFGVVQFVNGFIKGFSEGLAQDDIYQFDTKSFSLAIILSLIALLVYVIMIMKYKLQKASLIFANLAVLIAGMYLAGFLKTDYSEFGVLTIAVMYGLRKSHFKSMLGGNITLSIMTYFEIPSFIDLIFIRWYNGERGLKLRYVFYAFYPVHLFLLYLVCYFMDIL